MIVNNDITVGILQPEVPVPLMAAIGSDITLRVSVTGTDKNNYLRELTWYHNGVKINPTSNTRLNLTSDNTSLSISNVTDSDSGQYSVQYDGLTIYPYDSGCERQALELFRHYPLLAPAVLYLSTKGENKTAESQSPLLNCQQLFNENSTSVQLSIEIDPSIAVDIFQHVSIHWFHNGVLQQSNPASLISLSQSAKLTLDNPSLFDAGVYETQLRLHARPKFANCDSLMSYSSFMLIRRDRYGRKRYSPLVIPIRNHIQQLIYGKCILVMIQNDLQIFIYTETPEITCAAAESISESLTASLVGLFLGGFVTSTLLWGIVIMILL